MVERVEAFKRKRPAEAGRFREERCVYVVVL
jgi:hypothetical protein